MLKKNMYMTSLLSETLPLELLTEETLAEFEIDAKDSFGLIHIYFSNKLKNTIESKDLEQVANWKSVLHDNILAPMNTKITKAVCLLNMAPYTRTLVYSCANYKKEALRTAINDWFLQVTDYLDQEDIGAVVAFADSANYQLTAIGKSYKQLRLLMDYRFTIGMGNLMYYDQFKFDTPYSITEYKYLQRYETLISIDDFRELMALLEDIKNHIHAHLISDSKVIYIYKEIMAMTIRHLYLKETAYLQEIGDLNQSINDFEACFDDIDDVDKYLRKSIKHLSSMDLKASKDYHPHIRKVLRIIDERYDSNIGLKEIADEMKLSDAYLSRLFKSEMNVGFKDYLTRYRLNIIKDMLENSEKTVNEISELTGYTNPDQLTRIFKKYEQMTPSEYRHSQKG